MSKRLSFAVPSIDERPRPILPCPTSPMQQTADESWDHLHSDLYPARSISDHIHDRLPYAKDNDSDGE